MEDHGYLDSPRVASNSEDRGTLKKITYWWDPFLNGGPYEADRDDHSRLAYQLCCTNEISHKPVLPLVASTLERAIYGHKCLI